MLKHRSTEKEILDLGPGHYSFAEYKACMKKLFLVNKVFGFFGSTKHAIKGIKNKKTLIDIGCGSGLCILNLSKYFPNLKMTGLDISKDAINLANQELTEWKKFHPVTNVSFELQDQSLLLKSNNTVDIIISTLVCHHIEDDELVLFLKQMLACAKQAVILNDLHRNLLSYYFYALLSPILFRNKLITHDGLISIKRGFKRKDWIILLNKAGIKNYKIHWCFPFRWQVILWKK